MLVDHDPSLGLLTDLYQLTMGQAYWRSGLANRRAVFHLTFRRAPFGGAFAIAAGLGDAVEFLNAFRFSDEDVRYLETLVGADGSRLFESDYLRFIQLSGFACDVDAVSEGTVVFPHEPIVRIAGPVWQAQLIETALLTIINFQTLIATKAERICRAAEGEPVLEFGLRRAQGIDGGLSASRAAVIGGCTATSNVMAGRRYGLPVRGTHAHSWVMAFDSEYEAFERYAEAMPNNCVFLVDTYDTPTGVDRAIDVGQKLRHTGHRMIGVRLDSGDLCELSKIARAKLDAAGMTDTLIVASNDLDEYEIMRLKAAGAKINCWGVGTRLATSFDQPALGGVYKLAALEDDKGNWQYRVKLSNDRIKVSLPGVQQVRRYRQNDTLIADAIYNIHDDVTREFLPVDPENELTEILADDQSDLLQPIFRLGEQVADLPTIAKITEYRQREIASLPEHHRRWENPKPFPVYLERRLWSLRERLIAAARDGGSEP